MQMQYIQRAKLNFICSYMENQEPIIIPEPPKAKSNQVAETDWTLSIAMYVSITIGSVMICVFIYLELKRRSEEEEDSDNGIQVIHVTE
jgi:hypothetical protein